MAISTAMLWEVASGGSDTNNSGGFRGGAYISAPSAPTVTPSASGGTVAANTYYVVVTYTDGLGDTVISGQTAVTVSGGTASFTTTSPGAATGALTWNHYCATVSGGPYFPQGTGLAIGANRTVTTTPPTTGTQPRGVDRSLSTTRQVVIDNSTITATTRAANSNTLPFPGGYTPSGSDVGNMVRLTAGTNITAGDYEITAVTTTTWTLAGAANATGAGGAGSAIVGGMGGCFATPGQAAAFAIGGNTIYDKSPVTHTIANGTANTAGNKLSLTNIGLVGYATNRHPLNTDTKPVWDAGAASMTMLAMFGNPGAPISNISFTNSGTFATVTALSDSAQQASRRNLSFSGIATPISGNSSTFEDIYLTGCGSITAGNYAMFDRLVSVSGAANANVITIATGGHLKNSIIYGPSPQVAAVIVGTGLAENTIVYGATGVNGCGFQLSINGSRCVDCIAYGNSQSGFLGGSGQPNSSLSNCAAGGNGVDFDPYLASYQKINCVTLGGDPVVDAAGGDFALNLAAGAACRATGIPGTWAGLSTTSYRDIGPWQGSDAASGGGGPVVGPGSSFIRGVA